MLVGAGPLASGNGPRGDCGDRPAAGSIAAEVSYGDVFEAPWRRVKSL